MHPGSVDFQNFASGGWGLCPKTPILYHQPDVLSTENGRPWVTSERLPYKKTHVQAAMPSMLNAWINFKK